MTYPYDILATEQSVTGPTSRHGRAAAAAPQYVRCGVRRLQDCVRAELGRSHPKTAEGHLKEMVRRRRAPTTPSWAGSARERTYWILFLRTRGPESVKLSDLLVCYNSSSC